MPLQHGTRTNTEEDAHKLLGSKGGIALDEETLGLLTAPARAQGSLPCTLATPGELVLDACEHGNAGGWTLVAQMRSIL